MFWQVSRIVQHGCWWRSVRSSLWMLAFALAGVVVCSEVRAAEVTVTELADRLRVEVDGKLFTEWRHKDWVGPFLYPVIGPNGENITRHFPMKPGVPGEEQDHPWHRSIRFSHSDVNGFNFWWGAGKERAGHTAEIQLERIERLTSGTTGEAVFWNRWLGDGKLVLRERVRLAFTPVENNQLLMDYDTELHAGESPVLFGDKRDGGMLVRVAGTMKVEDEKGQRFAGEIQNSRGDRNRDAWGKRAEWADYCGPDATGKTVGIAIFDHPANLRFPTHWHARTYGLMTANRFGTDHFKANYDDHKTVICKPHKSANCAACNSHSGDYTIAAGASLLLRHRFFFHHGDAQTAKVAARYHEYAADRESVLTRMRELQRERRWKELIEQFEHQDFSTWPAEFAAQTAEAYHLRGLVYSFTKNGARAAADLQQAVTFAPRNEAYWLTAGDNFVNNLNDDERALAAYRQSLAITGVGVGWQPMTATTAIARILTNQVKPDEAIAVLKPCDNIEGIAPTWRIRLLRAYGHAYAAKGNEQESLAKFREALALETKIDELAARHAAKAQQPPLQVLMIGNSQCPTIINQRLIENLAASDKASRPIKITGCIKGGASLRSHWELGTGPETAQGMIVGGKWDFVVLQDIYNVQAAAFQPYARKFHQLIQQQGAQTVLFGTASILSDYPQGFERQHQLHLAMGKELKVPIVDASYAYFRYFGDKPSPELLESLFAKDRAHPGLRGSYIYACGIYSVLTGRNPAGLAAPLEIPADIATKLQATAWAQYEETKAALTSP